MLCACTVISKGVHAEIFQRMFKRRNKDGTFTSIYFPQPSLHIALMRADPWNEFLENRIDANSLLQFNSMPSAESDANFNQQVSDQLTVIAAVGPEPPPPISEVGIEDGPVGFLFRHPDAVVPQVTDVSTQEAPLPSEAPLSLVEEGPSIWSRFTTAISDFKNTAYNPLPSWYTNQMSLVVPTDEAVRSVIGSVYGGTRSLVRITVRVIEATDVPVADIWGTSDPYVCVALVRGVGGLSAGRLELLPTIGSVKTSGAKFATLNPKWNETLLMDDADLLSVISDSVLHVSLWDKDIIKTDDSIGYSVISLVDSLQASGVSPYPLLPIQITGSLIGPHAGLFVKINLRMVQKVGCLSVTPIAIQGFTRGWIGYKIRVDVKVTLTDPIASSTYMANGVCRSESSVAVEVNETGHAVWPKDTPAVTILFATPKKSKPYIHLTLKSDAIGSADPGQVALRIGMLEKLAGITPMRLSPMDGSVGVDVLKKCALYCGVECDLI